MTLTDTGPTATIRGAAALSEMLDCIGATRSNGDPFGDHAVAAILVDNEMNLRALLTFAMGAITDEMR